MRINRLFVEDPARLGYVNTAELHVIVDELPRNTSELEFASIESGVYSWQHFGPFVKFSFHPYSPHFGAGMGDMYDIGLSTWSSSAGAFNARVIPDKQVVDSILHIAGEPGHRSLVSGYALELDRATRLLKRDCPEWRFTVDPDAALRGDIRWVPTQLIPECLWYGSFALRTDGKTDVCGKAAYHPFRGRMMGLCDEHKAESDLLAAQMRAKYPVVGR